MGESTLEGAKRELLEETQLDNASWYDEPFCVTDSIHLDSAGTIAFHYVIAQCFAQVNTLNGLPPTVVAFDDAANAEWHSMEQIRRRVQQNESTTGIVKVIERAESLFQAGMLPLRQQ